MYLGSNVCTSRDYSRLQNSKKDNAKTEFFIRLTKSQVRSYPLSGNNNCMIGNVRTEMDHKDLINKILKKLNFKITKKNF